MRRIWARILGWTNTSGIDAALQAICLSAAYHTALVLLGEQDMVPLAMVLHRRIVGADRPFIVSDPRRACHTSGAEAVRAAMGGSLCFA